MGLLSRRLVVQGAEGDSPPTDSPRAACADAHFSSFPCAHNTSLSGFGATVMVMGNRSIFRASGLLVLRGGKTNVMGHYPLHQHFLLEAGASSSITDSAVWRSYYRCISTHATHGSRVERNVFHDVTLLVEPSQQQQRRWQWRRRQWWQRRRRQRRRHTP